MRLKRLTLRNIGPHVRFDADFQPGLVGIFGANGKGKSTLTNAIYANLTNDFSRFPGDRAKLINDLSGPKELSGIELDLDIDGVTYNLRRDLRPAKCRMSYQRPGQPLVEWDKDTDFQRELFNALGFPRDVLDNFVFINQWEMFAFLSATPAKRMMAFHGLCNTGKAEQIWDIVGRRIVSDASLVVEVQDNLAEYRQAKEDRAAEYKTRHEVVSSFQSRVSADEMTKLEKQIDELTQLANLRQNLAEAEEQLEQLTADANSAHNKLGPIYQERDRLTAAATAINTDSADTWIPVLQQYISQQKVIAADKAKIDELAAQIADLDVEIDSLELPESLEGILAETVTARVTLAKADLVAAQKFLVGFNKTGKTTCPTCGTSVEALIAKYRKQVADLPAQIEQDEETLEVLSDFAKSNQTLSSQRKQAAALLKSLQQRLDGTTFVVLDTTVLEMSGNQSPEEHLEYFEDVLAQKKAADQKLAAYTRSTVSPAELKVSSTRGAVKPTEQRVAQLRREAEKSASISDDKLEETRRIHSAAVITNNKYKTAYELAKAAKVAAETASQAYTQAKTTLADARQRSARARQWLEHLEKVREVFHRDSAPKLVAQSRLESLEDDINKFLEPFGSPFTVRAAEDFNLLAQVPGHLERPAQFLSGGQKVILSMAFLLSQSPGLLVLDEPGAGLDLANRNYLRTALQHFQQVAKSRGLQIVVITHDEELESAFNQTIRL